MNKLTSTTLACSLGLVALAGCATGPLAGQLLPETGSYSLPSQLGPELPASVQHSAASGYRVSSVGTAGSPIETERASADSGLGCLIQEQLMVYTESTRVIKWVLAKAKQAHLTPGKPYTFDDPEAPIGRLTFLLQTKGKQAVLAVGQGDSATGPDQVMSLAYSDPARGVAVIHVPTDAYLGRFVITERYDNEAGKASVDGVQDASRTPSAKRVAYHWEFAALKGATASFAMQVSAHLQATNEPDNSGVYALSANFRPDGSAAAIWGTQNAKSGNQFQLFTDDSGQTDAYIGANGRDLPRATAPAALRQIVPSENSLYRPFPANPAEGKPFEDPRFGFATL